MPINVLMPALSPTMTEGNLAKWHKKEGDSIRAGDVIAEIETDKATMEVEAVDEGVLAKIVVAEGTEGVKVNEVIAVIAEEGESVDDASAGAAGPSAGKAAPEAPPPATPAAEKPVTAGKGEKAEEGAPPASGKAEGGRVFASPLARRMAEQAGLDLSALQGSGPGGRIVKADIEASLSGDGSAADKAAGVRAEKAPAPVEKAPRAAPSSAPVDATLLPPYTEIKPSQMRKVIARRLLESKQTVPHFYVTVDCQIDRLLDVRKELNARAAEGRYKLSVNDLVIRAAALALKKVPEANAAWIDDTIRQYQHADISVAVAIEGGLITPVIRRADSKGLVEISSEMKDLAARARAGKLKPEEYQGGTFSISNLGMYGVRDFAAIINPPQGAILAVAAGEQRPVVKNGALAIATVMTCTLSVDHRVVDGTVGAQYLQALKGLLEDPLTMML